MPSYWTYWNAARRLFTYGPSSSQNHHNTATPECTGDIRAQDEVSSDNTDDDLDGSEDFCNRVNAIKDGAETRYNPTNELLPRLPAYHPSFLKAQKLSSELMEGAALILKNAEYKDDRILQLLEKASNSRGLEYPEAKIVGLIGDSGVGKSSLINCLLDTPDIALSGANGEACTNVITEYLEAQPSQETPFMAEIVLYEPASVQRMLAFHLGSHYRYMHRSVETMDTEAIDESDAHYETPVETFQTLFANREEFSNEERAKEFLEHAQSVKDPKILHILLGWIEESIPKSDAVGGIIRRNAYAPEELAKETERYTKSCKHLLDENDCHVSSLWPLVQQVRYFLYVQAIVDQVKMTKGFLAFAVTEAWSDNRRSSR